MEVMFRLENPGFCDRSKVLDKLLKCCVSSILLTGILGMEPYVGESRSARVELL